MTCEVMDPTPSRSVRYGHDHHTRRRCWSRRAAAAVARPATHESARPRIALRRLDAPSELCRDRAFDSEPRTPPPSGPPPRGAAARTERSAHGRGLCTRVQRARPRRTCDETGRGCTGDPAGRKRTEPHPGDGPPLESRDGQRGGARVDRRRGRPPGSAADERRRPHPRIQTGWRLRSRTSTRWRPTSFIGSDGSTPLPAIRSSPISMPGQ